MSEEEEATSERSAALVEAKEATRGATASWNAIMMKLCVGKIKVIWTMATQNGAMIPLG